MFLRDNISSVSGHLILIDGFLTLKNGQTCQRLCQRFFFFMIILKRHSSTSLLQFWLHQIFSFPRTFERNLIPVLWTSSKAGRDLLWRHSQIILQKKKEFTVVNTTVEEFRYNTFFELSDFIEHHSMQMVNNVYYKTSYKMMNEDSCLLFCFHCFLWITARWTGQRHHWYCSWFRELPVLTPLLRLLNLLQGKAVSCYNLNVNFWLWQLVIFNRSLFFGRWRVSDQKLQTEQCFLNNRLRADRKSPLGRFSHSAYWLLAGAEPSVSERCSLILLQFCLGGFFVANHELHKSSKGSKKVSIIRDTSDSL